MAALPDQSEAERLQVALAERLGLDPDKVAQITATVTGGDRLVRIAWEGNALMPIQEWVDLMNELQPRGVVVEG